MSKLIKLITALPGTEEWNGLDHYAEDCAADPTLMLGCWVVFDQPEAVISYDNGTKVPKLRVRQVEVITTDGSLPDGEFKCTVEKAFYERTGKMPLPLDEGDGAPVDNSEYDEGETDG